MDLFITPHSGQPGSRPCPPHIHDKSHALLDQSHSLTGLQTINTTIHIPTAASMLPDNPHSPHLTFNGFPLLSICLCDCVKPPLFCFFLLHIAMAMINFDTLLNCLQSSHSLPEEILISQEGLCFRDICFALPQCTLNMQHVSLMYQRSLISDNCFQPEGMPSDAVSSSTAILVVFLSDAKHMTIQHVHLSLVVYRVSCNLYDQSGILPFITSIKEDLEKVRQRHDMGKDPGGVHSYVMLVANFGGIMAIPMDPPYCLVYPIVYNDDVAAQNQNHFNTVGSPSGLCTLDLMCHALLQHADLTEAHKWKYEGSCLIVPCGSQYKTLFSEITMPRNHQGLLIDHKSQKSYPMFVVGDFCLVDKVFLGTPGDSLLFNGKDLARLKRKGYQVSTFKEEKPPPSSSKKEKQPSSHASEDALSSSSEGASQDQQQVPWSFLTQGPS